MLIKSQEFLVFGTRILLLGCEHREANAEYDPIDCDLYKRLNVFQPNVLMIELDDFYELEWVVHKTDTKTIYEYISDNNTDVYKYDLDKSKYNDVNLSIEKKSSKENPIDRAVDRRKSVKSNSLDDFRKMYKIREDKAAIEFIDVIRQYDRVAIHCGMAHYPAHMNHLNFLSEVKENSS